MKSRLRAAARKVNRLIAGRKVPTCRQPSAAVCVYRAENAETVRQMIEQLPIHCDVRLHALGEVEPSLADLTVSQGKGMRTELLQALVDYQPLPSDAWLILFDDDCSFARPGRTPFLDVAAAAHLDIAGPALGLGQPHSFRHTLVRPWTMARLVRLVEIGPAVALSPKAQEQVLPFPAEAGMGWGLDVLWSTLGLRMGYVDATPINHFGEVGASYDTSQERARTSRYLNEAGLSAITELGGTVKHWFKWRREAPWVALEESERG